jgi:AcrR family transcriptional regulator
MFEQLIKAGAQTIVQNVHQMADATRERILQAGLESLKRNGFAGSSTRAIGAIGGFNPALIHYYFGTLHGLLLAALEHASEERLAHHRVRLESAASLGDLIDALDVIYREDRESGFIRVVSEMVAGSVAHPELGPRVVELMQPWIALAEDGAQRALKGSPFEAMASPRELATAAVTFYLGTNLMTQLVPEEAGIEELLATARRLAPLLDAARD